MGVGIVLVFGGIAHFVMFTAFQRWATRTDRGLRWFMGTWSWVHYGFSAALLLSGISVLFSQ